MNTLPTKQENPKGLHQKYVIRKVIGFKRSGFFGIEKAITEAVDPDAEFFVLRLDAKQKDIHHRIACLKAIHAYADAIQNTIPQLAKDLRKRYPVEDKFRFSKKINTQTFDQSLEE